MYCLRCGVETDKEQVFCNKCLDNMERHPVKPGTPIKIPLRESNSTAKKNNRRKTVTPEEQVVRLKVGIRTLWALLLTAWVLIGILAFLYVREIKKPKSPAETKPEVEAVVDIYGSDQV